MSRYNSSLCVLALQIYNIIVICEPHNHPQMKCWLFLFLFFPLLLAGAWCQSSFLLPDTSLSKTDLSHVSTQTISWSPLWLSGSVDHESHERDAPKLPDGEILWNTVPSGEQRGNFFLFLFFWQNLGKKKNKHKSILQYRNRSCTPRLLAIKGVKSEILLRMMHF